MARRRKKKDQSILTTALNREWQYSASFATFLLVATLLIPAIISNRFLTPILTGLSPLGYMVSAAFYLIALFKFIGNETKELEEVHAFFKKPPITPNTATLKAAKDNLKETNNPAIKPTVWSLRLIQDLEWKRFEELSTAYYNAKGIRAETTTLGADGGIDIKLYQDDSGNPTSIVQCKAFANNVGVKLIREFLGVMTHEKIAKGFYMTTNGFTEEAKEIAKANHVTLINGEMLLMMIGRLNEASQQKLLALATEGDYKTPSCVSCGTKMKRRHVKSGKKPDFWGCANFPKCRQTLKLRAVDN